MDLFLGGSRNIPEALSYALVNIFDRDPRAVSKKELLLLTNQKDITRGPQIQRVLNQLEGNSVVLKIGLIGEPSPSFNNYLLIGNNTDNFVNIKKDEDPHKFLALLKSTATLPGMNSADGFHFL